jgi:hypothetical protein
VGPLEQTQARDVSCTFSARWTVTFVFSRQSGFIHFCPLGGLMIYAHNPSTYSENKLESRGTTLVWICVLLPS